MYAEERLREIADRTRSLGRVEVIALAAEFDVTPETIRKDLTNLERQGLVRRVHGGAIPITRLAFEPAVSQRAERMADEKDRIAKAALSELPQEGAVLLDAGTTTARIAELVPSDRELTVVTNSIPIGLTLSVRPNVQLMVTGGRIRSRTLAGVGDWTVEALSRIRVDVAYIGANGISPEFGLTTPDQAEAQAKRAMIAAARRIVVVADHTKLGEDYFAKFADLEQVDTIITDDGADAELASLIEARGPRVVLA